MIAPEGHAVAILESLLWRPQAGLCLLDAHLARLQKSCAYFGYSCNDSAVARRLLAATSALPPCPHKVRLTIAQSGDIDVTCAALQSICGRRLKLATSPAKTRSDWVFHKTTQRDIYHRALLDLPPDTDALLHNYEGQVTETTIANLVLETETGLVTPAATSGLLPGVLRAHLLAAGAIRECEIQIEQLRLARRLWLINSVRGWMTLRALTEPWSWEITAELGLDHLPRP